MRHDSIWLPWPMPGVICEFLPVVNILLLASTSRRLLHLRTEQSIWHSLYKRDFGPVLLWGFGSSAQSHCDHPTARDWALEYLWRVCYAPRALAPLSLRDAVRELQRRGVLSTSDLADVLQTITAAGLSPRRVLPPGALGELVCEYRRQPNIQAAALRPDFNFAGKQLGHALWELLGQIVAPNESSLLHCFLGAFGQLYAADNPESGLTADSVLLVSFALLLLSTDQNLLASITEDFFATNLRGLEGVTDPLCRELYRAELERPKLRMQRTGVVLESAVVLPFVWAMRRGLVGAALQWGASFTLQLFCDRLDVVTTRNPAKEGSTPDLLLRISFAADTSVSLVATGSTCEIRIERALVAARATIPTVDTCPLSMSPAEAKRVHLAMHRLLLQPHVAYPLTAALCE
eukprot:TRINITY_DN19110_c0_g1_i1.p1 TRINITY_DN19110_c0_g1~~TRINITY_DN19110_c0_g1_i1.p1  ORF type:complete len:405 (-),score=35.69 TRINITY_DN19110_c0_g1_i1:30-1244(-)